VFPRICATLAQNLYDATEVLIEDKASGTQLIQELIADGCYGVTRYLPTTDKIMRLNAQTAIIENGFVHIPEAAPWLAEYLHEMTVFPKGKHDGQVDSTAQFLNWIRGLSRARVSSSITASAPKNSSSSAAGNPSNPCGPRPHECSPSNRKRVEP
jgi:predicted phage terminase large subunit-like protein